MNLRFRALTFGNMPRLSAFLFFFLAFSFCKAQPSDFIIVKKKNGRTVKSYYSGVYIDFYDVYGNEFSGMIRKIEKDSIYVSYYDIRMMPTPWGTRVQDTLATYLNHYHYGQIYSIPKERQAFEFVRNGTFFMIAGVGYAVLHLVNAAYLKDEVDGKSMAIAGGVAATGLVMRLLRKKSYVMGKKYHLQYVKVKP